MIRVGIVGFGFMGRMHYKCWKLLDDVEIAAVCDTNPNAFQDTGAGLGNIGSAAEVVDSCSLKLYQDFEKMVREEKLDAISLTLPTYLHADYSVKALEAGVNVLCEKPMALDVADCQRMIEAATKYRRILQIGHCVRFWPEYAKAKEIVASGKYGRVVAATFRRLGSAPDWAWDNWIMDEQRSGGMLLDLHIHDTDFVQYLFGMPRAVCSFAAKGIDGQLMHIATQYVYHDDRVVTAEGSWAIMPAFGFEMSFNIMLEKATLVYDCTRQPTFRICPAREDSFTPELPNGDGYLLEIVHFSRMIKGETVDTVTTPEESLNSVKIVHAEKESASKHEQVLLV
jgi:predicted dehydrogenase